MRTKGRDASRTGPLGDRHRLHVARADVNQSPAMSLAGAQADRVHPSGHRASRGGLTQGEPEPGRTVETERPNPVAEPTGREPLNGFALAVLGVASEGTVRASSGASNHGSRKGP
jgi:hypothetical protein